MLKDKLRAISDDSLDRAEQEQSASSRNNLENIRFEADTNHRRKLVYWVMWVDSIWLAAVLLIVALSGSITPSVLIALLTTTTANVIGLALVVLRGLFKYRI